MSEETECIGCARSVAAGAPFFAGRLRTGDRFLCQECAELREASQVDSAARNRVLTRIKDYGIGMAGGRTGATGGPG